MKEFMKKWAVIEFACLIFMGLALVGFYQCKNRDIVYTYDRPVCMKDSAKFAGNICHLCKSSITDTGVMHPDKLILSPDEIESRPDINFRDYFKSYLSYRLEYLFVIVFVMIGIIADTVFKFYLIKLVIRVARVALVKAPKLIYGAVGRVLNL